MHAMAARHVQQISGEPREVGVDLDKGEALTGREFHQMRQIAVELRLAADELDLTAAQFGGRRDQPFIIASRQPVAMAAMRMRVRIAVNALQVALISQFEPEER